jgi:hypothetical protein
MVPAAARAEDDVLETRSVPAVQKRGINLITFAAGSPTPTVGGVNVTVNIQPTTGYTCNAVTISVLDSNNNQLGTTTIIKPGATASASFTGLGSGTAIEVLVDATFQFGNMYDFKDISANTTTN